MNNYEAQLNEWTGHLEQFLQLGEQILSCPWQPVPLVAGQEIDPTETSRVLQHLREREHLFQRLQELGFAPPILPGEAENSIYNSETNRMVDEQSRIRKLMVQVVEQNEQIADFLRQNMESIRHAQNHLLLTQRMKSGYQPALRFARPGLAINHQA